MERIRPRSRIGLLLACPHYPDVSERVADLHPRLLRWLRSAGTTPECLAVYAAFEGALPRHAAECEAWILSGLPLDGSGAQADTAEALATFVRSATALGRTLFALNRAEHLLHDALAAADAPAPRTTPMLRAIRNPFAQFHRTDALYRFDPALRSVLSMRPRSEPRESAARPLGGRHV